MTWLSLAHCWSRLQTTINQSEISIVLCQPIREEYYSPWPARYWGSALTWEDQWTGVCWSSPLESCCTACTCQSTNQRSVLVCVNQSQSCTDLGLMRSTALISLPHLSHWSPLASLYPHPASGHSPSTNLAKSSLVAVRTMTCDSYLSARNLSQSGQKSWSTLSSRVLPALCRLQKMSWAILVCSCVVVRPNLSKLIPNHWRV